LRVSGEHIPKAGFDLTSAIGVIDHIPAPVATKSRCVRRLPERRARDKSCIPAISKNEIKFGNNLRKKKGDEAELETDVANIVERELTWQPLQTNMRGFAYFSDGESAWLTLLYEHS
jgi:hypothetical protein